MKHNKITVVSISDPTGTMTPSAGANGELGPLALLTDVKSVSAINQSQQITLSQLTALTGSSGGVIVAAVSAGLDSRITTLENGGRIFSGQTPLITGSSSYSISHINITGSSYPIVSLVVPSSGAVANVPAISNVSTSGFEVSFTATIDENGYKLNWERSVSGIATVYNVSNNVPALSSSAGNFKDIAIDNNYIYVCIETNTWKRAALSPF